MQLTYELDCADYIALINVIRARARDVPGGAPYPLVRVLLASASAIAVVGLFRIILDYLDIPFGDAWPIILLTIGACFISFSIYLQNAQDRLLPSEDGTYLGSQTIRIDANGVKTEASSVQAQYDWSAFSGFVETQERVFLLVDRNGGLVIPRSAFRSIEDSEDFARLVRQFVSAA